MNIVLKSLSRAFVLQLTLLLVGCTLVVPSTPTSPDVPASSSSTSPASSNTRTITDMAGEVEVPAAPQRILAQDYLGELLALGISPIGASDRFFDESDLFTPYLDGIERLGQANNISLEKATLLDPDLILVNQYLAPDIVSQLQAIAPTVVLNDNADAFTRLRTVATVVGSQDEAESWIADYTQQQEETRQAVAGLIEADETALILTMWQDLIWVQATRSVGQTIYETVGFQPPSKIAAEVEAIMSGANTDGQSGYLEISLELLPEYAADADRIFLLLASDDASQEAFANYVDNPLWQTLPAVQSQQVYHLNSNWGWYNPIGLAWELNDVVELLQAE